MERNEYDKFTPSGAVEYFEKIVLWHITQLEQAMADKNVNVEVYNLRVCRPYNLVDVPLRVEAMVQLKSPKTAVNS
jgi:hypothetical protein